MSQAFIKSIEDRDGYDGPEPCAVSSAPLFLYRLEECPCSVMNVVAVFNARLQSCTHTYFSMLVCSFVSAIVIIDAPEYCFSVDAVDMQW
jgi:hypothetical protein